MTTQEARTFFIKSLNSIMNEATQDLTFALAEINGGEMPREYAMPKPTYLE